MKQDYCKAISGKVGNKSERQKVIAREIREIRENKNKILIYSFFRVFRVFRGQINFE